MDGFACPAHRHEAGVKRGVMRSEKSLVFVLALALLVTSCSTVEKLNEFRSGGTITALWPDVPAIDGAARADDELTLPVMYRVMLQGYFGGKLDYIAYTSNKPAEEIRNYYTPERMKEHGWKNADTKGQETEAQNCISDKTDAENYATACIYGKAENGKAAILALIITRDEKAQKTNIFYARMKDLPEQTFKEQKKASPATKTTGASAAVSGAGMKFNLAWNNEATLSEGNQIIAVGAQLPLKWSKTLSLSSDANQVIHFHLLQLKEYGPEKLGLLKIPAPTANEKHNVYVAIEIDAQKQLRLKGSVIATGEKLDLGPVAVQ